MFLITKIKKQKIFYPLGQKLQEINENKKLHTI